MQLSSLLDRFSEPETLRMARLGRELREKGIDIIDLSLGEPDFDTPEHIKVAAKKAIDENWSHYTPVGGYMELKEAICQKFKRDNGLDYKPENIVVSTGAKQSLANVILSIINKDDEVLIPTPYWVTYSALIQLAAITPQTKLFIFSSPCNPSGSVYSKDELAALVSVFEKNPHVFIISDEIYEYINFVGGHQSIASFETVKDRTIIINGLSKGFAMTGWRLGYIAAPAAIAKACEKLQGQFTSGTNAITQRAAITALTSSVKRKEKVLELIKEIPGLRCAIPDGAFYIFPEVNHYFGKSAGDHKINNADDLCMYLLNEAHVSTVTGSAFGNDECIRISFANSMEKIEEGFRRITKAFAQLK